MFTKLNLVMDGIACVRIADPEVLRILIEKLDVDDIGAISEKYVFDNQFELTSSWFKGNTLIETFDELEIMNVAFPNDYWADNLFTDCTSLRSIKTPYTITFLPDGCFQRCSNLTNIVLHDGLEKIGKDVFRGCTALKEVRIPNTITKIENFVFQDSGIETLDLPESVTSIGSSVFNGLTSLKTMIIRGNVIKEDGVSDGSLFKCWENCTGLESFIMLSKTPMGFGFWMMNGTTCKIYVPDTSVNAYKAASGWNGLGSRIRPLSEYKGKL